MLRGGASQLAFTHPPPFPPFRHCARTTTAAQPNIPLASCTPGPSPLGSTGHLRPVDNRVTRFAVDDSMLFKWNPILLEDSSADEDFEGEYVQVQAGEVRLHPFRSACPPSVPPLCLPPSRSEALRAHTHLTHASARASQSGSVSYASSNDGDDVFEVEEPQTPLEGPADRSYMNADGIDPDSITAGSVVCSAHAQNVKSILRYLLEPATQEAPATPPTHRIGLLHAMSQTTRRCRRGRGHPRPATLRQQEAQAQAEVGLQVHEIRRHLPPVRLPAGLLVRPRVPHTPCLALSCAARPSALKTSHAHP